MTTVLADGVEGAPAALWWAAVALPASPAVAYAVVPRRLTGDLHYALAALRSGRSAG
jgi:hypothetical protein